MGAEFSLDCKGLKCPQPVIRIKKHISRMGPGDTLTVICTDPLSMIDVPHFVASENHSLLSKLSEAGEYHFVIQKRDTTRPSG